MTHLCSDEIENINNKLDIIIEMLKGENKVLWKGFGLDILANLVGNAIDGNRRN